MSFVLNDAQRYFELKLFECGREQTIPNKVFAFTPKDYYVVHIVIAGQGVFATDNRVYKLKKGDLFFIGPHEHPHYYPDKKDPWLYLWLGFGGLHAAHYLHEAGISSDSPIIQDDHDGKLRMFLEQIYDCYTEHGFLDLNALGLTYQFMAALIHQKHNAATLSIKHRHFNRAKEYIYNNFAFDIKVSDIAGNVGITPNYLSNIFTELVGISTKEYITSVRIERAKQLLVMTSKPIKVISGEVGYQDALYFSNAFKKHTNLSPKQYRQKEQNYVI